tara:strand:+ start:280 stop:414 length:135 start_codon:yes stop_codon:yes gene_type:complete
MNALAQELISYFGRYKMHLVNYYMVFNWFEERKVYMPARAFAVL